jgi:hypothetical protein
MSYQFEPIQTSNSILNCAIDGYGKTVVYIDKLNETQMIYVLENIDSSLYSSVSIPWPEGVRRYEYILKDINLLTYKNSYYLCASFYQESSVTDLGDVFIGESLLYLYSRADESWTLLSTGSSTKDGYYSSIISLDTTFIVTYTQYETKAVYDSSLERYLFYRNICGNGIYSHDIVSDKEKGGVMNMIPESDQYYWNGPLCILSDSGNDIFGVCLLDSSKQSLIKYFSEVSSFSSTKDNVPPSFILDIMQYDIPSRQWTSTGFSDIPVEKCVNGFYSTVNRNYVLSINSIVYIYDLSSCTWSNCVLTPFNDGSIINSNMNTNLKSINCYTDADNVDHIFILSYDNFYNNFLYISHDNGNTWNTQSIANQYDAWSGISCSAYGTLILGEYYNNPQAGNVDMTTPSKAQLFIGNFVKGE